MDSIFFEKERLLASSLGQKYVLTQTGHELKEVLKGLKAGQKSIIISNTDFRPCAETQELMNRACLGIIHPNSGHDNFSKTFIAQKNFPVILGNTIRAQAVAEYTLSAVFDSMAPVLDQKTWQKTRYWNRPLAREKTVQLIGLGHIGKILYNFLCPLFKKVFVFDPQLGHDQLHPGKADYIILACSLNESSFQIIDRDFLSSLKPSAVLINPARGGLVDLDELILHLKNCPEFRAYLDVYPQEPAPLDNWKDLQNLFCSSHMAGCFKELNESILDFEEQACHELLTATSNSLARL